MVIGSDRMELYEYFARRKETWQISNRGYLKFGVALTMLHFCLVRIPQLSSRFFGDSIDVVSKVAGAKDESTLNEKLERARENRARRGGDGGIPQ